jgi:hypothetical protein
MSKQIGSGRTSAGWARRVLTASAVAACAVASSMAQAGTVTFDWFQTGGTMTATGTLTITSSLITPADTAGTAQFDIDSANLPAGESFITELSSLSFTMGSQTLTAANLTSDSTGWTDDYPGETANVLESTWAASKTFSGGTLSLVGNSTPTSDGALVTVTMGTNTAMGEWKLAAPVPLPASVWLLFGGLGGLFAFGRRVSAARRAPALVAIQR